MAFLPIAEFLELEAAFWKELGLLRSRLPPVNVEDPSNQPILAYEADFATFSPLSVCFQNAHASLDIPNSHDASHVSIQPHDQSLILYKIHRSIQDLRSHLQSLKRDVSSTPLSPKRIHL